MYAAATVSTARVSPTPQAIAGDIFTLIRRWLTTLEVADRANARTRRSYRRIVMDFVTMMLVDPDWLGGHDPMLATEDDVVLYLEAIGPQGGARGLAIRALRSFYGWAVERGEVAVHPLRAIKPRRVKYGPAPSLTPEDTEVLLRAAEDVDPRARWAIQLQIATACRAGSLVALMSGDIQHGPNGSRIIFREAKGDRSYQVPLGPKGSDAASHLLELLDWHPLKVATRRPTLLGVGYSSYARWVQRAGELAGVKSWSHLLRHTAITRLAEDPTVAPRTIMEVANWEDLSLMRRYAAASDSLLRNAMQTHG